MPERGEPFTEVKSSANEELGVALYRQSLDLTIPGYPGGTRETVEKALVEGAVREQADEVLFAPFR